MENFNTSNKKYRKIGPYVLIKPIGKGAYSTVYEAKKENEPQLFAIKQISLMNLTQKQQQRLHIQIKVLELIKHRNIVSLVDFKQTSSNLYLVFQYCKHTDLQAHVQRYSEGKLPEDKVRKIAIQIKNAFVVLRANKVVHRDLKLANILVTDQFEIKLADFGFAKLLDDDEFFKSYVGTPLTMAPEIMENRSYNQKCDLWSLGIVIYQLLFGSNPFFTKNRMTKVELKNAIKAQLKIPSLISEEAADLLKKLIVREPSERISFDEFFKHPWLTQNNSKETINEFLLQETLRVELGKCLLKTTKKKDQKEFMIRKGEDLLAYQIIQHIKNGIQTKIMYWINLGKKIMGFNYYNTKLTFLSLAIILDNIQRCLENSLEVNINKIKKIVFPVYMKMRDLQKWEMSEYTKRLPDFLERTQKKMINYIKELKVENAFSFEASNLQLIELFLTEVLREIQKSSSNNEYLSTFLKVKPWQKYTLELRLQSPIFPQKTLKLILQKLDLKIENNKMYKRCTQIFQIQNISHSSLLDKIYENIKLIYD